MTTNIKTMCQRAVLKPDKLSNHQVGRSPGWASPRPATVRLLLNVVVLLTGIMGNTADAQAVTADSEEFPMLAQSFATAALEWPAGVSDLRGVQREVSTCCCET